MAITPTVRRKFNAFLRENGLASEYYVNHAIYYNKHKKQFARMSMKVKKDPAYLIMSAFDWGNTSQGIMVWVNLDRKWLCEIRVWDTIGKH